MPILRCGEGDRAANIYYRVYGEIEGHSLSKESSAGKRALGNERDKRPCVVLIMGFAAAHSAWLPQLHGLLTPDREGGPSPVRVMVLDNRGVGRSSAPLSKHAYSTRIMATDVLTVMVQLPEHLGWEKVHIVGHSMGGMAAMTLAAMVPERVASLSVVSSTGGGWETLPLKWRAIRYAWKVLRAATPRARAKMDLKFHFSESILMQKVTQKLTGLLRTHKSALLEEYCQGVKEGDPSSGQPSHAMKGQLWAVWKHAVSAKEYAAIKSGGFPSQVIHGRHDIVALPKYGERLAGRLNCPCVILEGAHFLIREHGTAVNALLKAIILPDTPKVLHGPEPHAYMATYFVSSILELSRVSVTPPSSAMAGTVTAMIDMTSNGLKGTSDCGSVSSLTPLANGDALSYGVRN